MSPSTPVTRTKRPPAAGPRQLPDGTKATGWFQVGWSGDFTAGSPAKPLRYFGSDLVGYRTQGGRFVLMEAYCPHMGAHLGYGGTVNGNSIVCPFHGWEWDSDGQNSKVPYGPRDQVNRRLRIFPTREIDGLIMAWHDPLDRIPFLDCQIRQADSDHDLLPSYPDNVLKFEGRSLVPQMPIENLVDFAHFKWVHKAAEIGDLVDFRELGTRFQTTIRLAFGVGRESTWLTPNGPVVGRIVSDVWSVGLFTSRFELGEPGRAEMILVNATTPVDATTSDMSVSLFVRDGSVAERWLSQERFQSEQDLLIWENGQYLPTPLLSPAEGAGMRALRNWAYQFYQGDSNGHLPTGDAS